MSRKFLRTITDLICIDVYERFSLKQLPPDSEDPGPIWGLYGRRCPGTTTDTRGPIVIEMNPTGELLAGFWSFSAAEEALDNLLIALTTEDDHACDVATLQTVDLPETLAEEPHADAHDERTARPIDFGPVGETGSPGEPGPPGEAPREGDFDGSSPMIPGEDATGPHVMFPYADSDRFRRFMAGELDNESLEEYLRLVRRRRGDPENLPELPPGDLSELLAALPFNVMDAARMSNPCREIPLAQDGSQTGPAESDDPPASPATPTPSTRQPERVTGLLNLFR